MFRGTWLVADVAWRQLTCARMGCAVLAESCPSPVVFTLLDLSDSDEVKYKNAHLSHNIWYSYAYISIA